MATIDHFKDLPPNIQSELLHYIALNFKVQSGYNRRHSAYKLKQHFSSTCSTPEYHVTNECFSEAMLVAGFKRIPANETETNWHFNARVPNILKP